MFGIGNNIGIGVGGNAVVSSTTWFTEGKADGIDPSLWADFANDRYAVNGVSKPFADIFTLTRSTTGTYFDAAGVMQTAAINAPRYDYDPVTLETLGLLVEEQRTNLLTYSVPTNGQWGVNGSTDTYDAQVSPDGLTKATLSTANIGTSSSFSNCNNVSFSSGVVYTSSVFVKAATVS